MYSKPQFESDFIKAYGYRGLVSIKNGQLTILAVRHLDACYQTYKNSASNPLAMLVVGRIVKRDGTGERIGLGDDERTNFGKTNSASKGSVLAADDWGLEMNDAWLMGGIHARLNFHVASPRTENNILDPTYGATVTGRELLGLTTFGYTLHPNSPLEEVYVCTDQSRALGATFVAYQKAFDAAKASGGFSRLVNRHKS